MRKATHKRVLIGIVYTTLGEGCRGNIGQLDKDLTVKDIGQLIKWGDISLVSRRGQSRSPSAGLSIYKPLLQNTVSLL